jgi:hypothetical protein
MPVQPANIAPPANWTSNWLPSPSDGSGFNAFMRFYGTQDAMGQGNWTFSSVTKIKAITDGTSTGGSDGTVAERSYTGANAASGWSWSMALSVAMGIAAVLLATSVP